MRRRRIMIRAQVATTLSLVLAVIGGLLFLLSPIAPEGPTPVGPGQGAPDAPASATSAIEELGLARAVALAGFPALVTAIPVAGGRSRGSRGLRILATVMLGIYVLVALPFGLFFAPAALAMLLASVARGSPPARVDPAGNGSRGRGRPGGRG